MNNATFEDFARYMGIIIDLDEHYQPTCPVIQDTVNQIMDRYDFPSLTRDIVEKDFKVIFYTLMRKFRHWQMRYIPSSAPYGSIDYSQLEFSRIIIDIYPAYYWMKRKNMISNLDSFADMNNWGQREKANIKQLIVENYIPLNNDIETPHSSTPTTTTQESQYIDFIKYYQSLSIVNNKLFDSIYTEFMPLFKLIYV